MTDNQDNVYKTYDKIANWFDQHRSRELFEKPWLDKAAALLPDAAQVLDLGCGMGEPMIPYFIEKGFEVTGVDGSEKLIALAKKRLLNTKFIVSDMRDLKLDQQFDMVVAWHSFFHLSQDDQRSMFKTFGNHLNKDGVLLFTSGTNDGEVWSDNGGENLYHASLSQDEYKHLLTVHGFELISYTIKDKSCGDATVWMARYQRI